MSTGNQLSGQQHVGVLTVTGGEDSAFVTPQLILTEKVLMVGRAAHHQKGFLNIKQPYVSGKHFYIEDHSTEQSTEPQFVLTDLSTNGTYLNDASLGKGKSARLRSGDTLAIKFKEQVKVCYTFNVVRDLADVPHVSPPPPAAHAAAAAANGGGPTGGPAKQRSDAEFELQGKQIALFQGELEELESRLAAAVAKKEAATRDLSVVQRQKDAALSAAAELKERVSDLEAHKASVEARSRVQEEQVAALQGQLEAQKAKVSASLEMEVQLEEFKAKVSTLKEELSAKAAQADSRQRLLDESNQQLAKEADARTGAEATITKLRNALQSINTDLYSSEIEKSSSSIALADAAQKLGAAMANEKRIKTLLYRSQRVILAQRDALSGSMHSLTALYKQLGQVLSAQMRRRPIDLSEKEDSLHNEGLGDRTYADSQIEEIRAAKTVDVTSFQSLLGIVEAEVVQGADCDPGLAETCADSVLTCRLPSLRSNVGGGVEDSGSQMSMIGEGLGVQDETQAQNYDASNTHFATQQGDSDSPVAVDNIATEVPREYQSPSEFMSPVTTPPNSAASALPSGVKVRYRHEEGCTTPEGDRIGVRLKMDALVSNGASPSLDISFKRPLDVVMASSERDTSHQSSDGGDSDSEDRPRKMPKKDFTSSPSDQKLINADEDVTGIDSENVKNVQDDGTPGMRL